MNTKSLVDAIRRKDKHAGHSGGIDGCPLCDRAAEKALLEDLGAEPTQEEPKDPIFSRIASILGDE